MSNNKDFDATAANETIDETAVIDAGAASGIETVVVDPEGEAEQTPPSDAKTSKSRKKGMWIAAAVAAVLVVGGGIATPSIVHSVQHSQASTAFVSGEHELTDASKELATAEAKLDNAKTTAAERYTELKALSDVTPADYVADAALLEEYKTLLADYAVTSELTLDDKLNVAVPDEGDEATLVEKPKPIQTPETVDELRADAEDFVKDAKELRKAAAAANKRAEAIAGAYEPILEQGSAIVESAHTKGMALAAKYPAKATEATKKAFAAAVAAIAPDALTEESELPALVKAYVDSWAAVNNSHNAAVAAEKKAAEEAQRSKPNANNNNRGSDRSSGGSKGHGGSNGTAPTKPGGGTGTAPTKPGGGTGTAPTKPSVPKRGNISKTGSACQGSGGQASGNWTSNLVAPRDAGSVWVTHENRGQSWGIAWECDLGGW